jgi:hypothetical protein
MQQKCLLDSNPPTLPGRLGVSPMMAGSLDSFTKLVFHCPSPPHHRFMEHANEVYGYTPGSTATQKR